MKPNQTRWSLEALPWVIDDRNGYEGVIQIPQIFKAGASPSDGLMSYLGHSLVEFYSST